MNNRHLIRCENEDAAGPCYYESLSDDPDFLDDPDELADQGAFLLGLGWPDSTRSKRRRRKAQKTN